MIRLCWLSFRRFRNQWPTSYSHRRHSHRCSCTAKCHSLRGRRQGPHWVLTPHIVPAHELHATSDAIQFAFLETDHAHTSQRNLATTTCDLLIHSINKFLLVSCCIQALFPLYTLLGEYTFKNRKIINDLAAQISSKSEDRSQQARIPAPATDNLNTIHDVDAKKLAHAPPVYLESDQAASRLPNPGNHDWNPMTPEEKADAKKLAHAPSIYFEPDQAKPGALRLGDPDNDDHLPVTSREDEHVLIQHFRPHHPTLFHSLGQQFQL